MTDPVPQAGRSPFRLGLTGSIGMGKSTIAAMFAARGIPVFDADAQVHRLQQEDRALIAAIEARFPGVRSPTGVIDRQALGARVFGDPAALARLAALIRPGLARAMAAFLTRHQQSPLVVFDVPLLLEKPGLIPVDAILVVSASEAAQTQRVMARPGMTAEKFAAIRARQMPDAEKRARATYIIDTGGTLEESRDQVLALIDRLVGAPVAGNPDG